MQLKNDNISQALQNTEGSVVPPVGGGQEPCHDDVPPLPPRLRLRPLPQTPPKKVTLQPMEGELGVYKSVPPPRELAGHTGGQLETGRRTDHPLSGSEPALADLTGRLVPAQLTRLPAPNTWRHVNSTTPPNATDTADPDASAPANGLLTKKYHHIKDMLSSRFSRSSDADGRGIPLTSPEHSSAVDLSVPPTGSTARGAPLRSSVRSLAGEEGGNSGDRPPWQTESSQRSRVASLGARYEYGGGQNGPGSAQRPLTNGASAGDQQYHGYTNGGREYHPQGYEVHEYPHASAAGPQTNGAYGAGVAGGQGGAGGAPLPRLNDPRSPRPLAVYPATSGPVRPAGFSSHQPRPPPPLTQPRPPPPAYGTRLPPPGHYLSRQGSQGRPPADSLYGQGRGTAATTVTARPAVSSGGSHQEQGPRQESGGGDRSRSGETQQASVGRPVAADSRQGAAPAQLDSSLDSEGRPRTKSGGQRAGQTTGNDPEWADTETELRQILDPNARRPDLTSAPPGAPSTPPLPALDGSPPRSPAGTPRMGSRGPTGPSGGANQPDLLEDTAAPGGQFAAGRIGSGSASRNRQGQSQSRGWAPHSSKESPTMVRDARERSRQRGVTRVGSLGVIGQANDSRGDLLSLDLESALDQTSEQSTDESTVLEAGVDGPTVRRQLQSLETMYSEVLRLLGGQKRGQPARPARGGGTKLRPGSSVSSLPSSIGAKPARDRRRDDRKQLRDSKGINKRFQRLESHVVTLARSVAHLSSEMRTQHLMFQEMESIRSELAQLRQSPAGGPRPGADFATFRPSAVSLTHPPRVKKLTRFFGDEPPLLRIFLNQLGYEKYAPLFERERIGMLELPYMTEERLQKLGVPIGPRLRILHEAQLSMRNDSPNVYIL